MKGYWNVSTMPLFGDVTKAEPADMHSELAKISRWNLQTTSFRAADSRPDPQR